jgi:3-hydroxyacyl-[acyl-carrier-protein] dehydratase
MMTPEQVNEAMRRCAPEAIDAAVRFQADRDPALVPTIVIGIIERYVEPQNRPKVRHAGDDTRLYDDLGIDSLMMVEIVMTIEEVLGVTAPDEELRALRTIGDVKGYLDAKLRGVPFTPSKPPVILSQADIAATLPQQAPFLFVQNAKVGQESASGTYSISGEEEFLKGHFKDGPVFPASIMIEALGQLATLLILKSEKPELASALAEGKAWFASADEIRCMRVCKPGDTLTLQVKLLRVHAPLATLSGTISVGDQKTATIGELNLAFGTIQPAAEAKPATTEPAHA